MLIPVSFVSHYFIVGHNLIIFAEVSVCRVLSSGQLAEISQFLNIEMADEICSFLSETENDAFVKQIESVQSTKAIVTIVIQSIDFL